MRDEDDDEESTWMLLSGRLIQQVIGNLRCAIASKWKVRPSLELRKVYDLAKECLPSMVDNQHN